MTLSKEKKKKKKRKITQIPSKSSRRINSPKPQMGNSGLFYFEQAADWEFCLRLHASQPQAWIPSSVLEITIISWRNQAISLFHTKTPFNSEIRYLTSIAGCLRNSQRDSLLQAVAKSRGVKTNKTKKLGLILGPLCLKVPITMT